MAQCHPRLSFKACAVQKRAELASRSSRTIYREGGEGSKNTQARHSKIAQAAIDAVLRGPEIKQLVQKTEKRTTAASFWSNLLTVFLPLFSSPPIQRPRFAAVRESSRNRDRRSHHVLFDLRSTLPVHDAHLLHTNHTWAKGFQKSKITSASGRDHARPTTW